ncbi:hypothetical protein GCM10007160_25390 [Litchfieldella qijiaojingensis]|uniref:DUF3102 domain-containing protein n=1 Tax=Litchfieldella qijiaojingensis TaxID=980347 RepID=A0ABQ2YZ04_9GAMM|nr:hypothetical protein [Halomonas qijiaojingensis]GGX96688.1 hypothetical protein GCM10007160_25390 [Halomonas qijiaojingensis]
MAKQPQKHAELQDQLEHADLAERQLDERALIEGAEQAELARYSEARDQANQLLGQARTAQSFAKLATVVTLRTLAEVKQTKAYRALRGVSGVDSQGNKIDDVGTWEGYCQAIGRSKTSVDEDLRNLAAFGEEALESLRTIGAGYRELRKLRQLPDEERELIIQGEAVKIEDKDALVELIEDMAARHAKEKDALKSQAEESRQELEASRRVTQDKSNKIAELEEQLHRRQHLTPDQRVQELSDRLEAEGFKARSLLLPLRAVMVEILDWEEAPRELRHACAQQVARLRIELDQLERELDLEPVDLDIDDSWMQGGETS